MCVKGYSREAQASLSPLQEPGQPEDKPKLYVLSDPGELPNLRLVRKLTSPRRVSEPHTDAEFSRPDYKGNGRPNQVVSEGSRMSR